MASFVYNVAKAGFANGTLDWDTNTFKIMLIDNAYTPNPDHATVSALTELPNGTGYTGGFNGAGRKTLSVCSVVQVDASDRAELRVSLATTWSAINAGTAKAAVVIREMTSDADSIPVAYIDSGGWPIVTNGGDLTCTWNAAGAIQLG